MDAAIDFNSRQCLVLKKCLIVVALVSKSEQKVGFINTDFDTLDKMELGDCKESITNVLDDSRGTTQKMDTMGGKTHNDIYHSKVMHR